MSDENMEALVQDIMKRSEDLVAANFWKILQVHELLMERRRIDGEDIAGIIESYHQQRITAQTVDIARSLLIVLEDFAQWACLIEGHW